MATVNYVQPGADITPDAMNELVGEQSRKMGLLFGNRSPIVAWNPANGLFPARLLGKVVRFTDGATTYSQTVHGHVNQSFVVPDPVVGGTAVVTGARSYNHAPFTAAVASAVVEEYDEANSIALIHDIAQASYPTGITKQNAVSLFDYSLEAHTKMLQGPNDAEPRKYWLQEKRLHPNANTYNGGGWFSTKRYSHALLDVLIEGVSTVIFPDNYDTFSNTRWHSLWFGITTVTWRGHTFTLQPFECRTFRCDVDGANVREGFRYFPKFEDDDARMFAFWSTVPNFGGSFGFSDIAVTNAAGMQANPIACPVILYEWRKWFQYRTDGAPQPLAWWKADPHLICDLMELVPDYADKFHDPDDEVNTDILFGDLIHHKGDLLIARTSRTINDPSLPVGSNIKQVIFDSVTFNGYKTIVADFAAKQIAVTVNGAGNLQLLSTDAANRVDLISISTNLLKKRSYGGDGNYQVIPTAVNIDTAYELEFEIFENIGQADEDIFGVKGFNLSNRSSYRLTEKQATALPAVSQPYVDANLVVHPVNVPGGYSIQEAALVTSKPMVGIHAVKASEVAALLYFRNPPPYSAGVDFIEARFKFTPFGVCLLFTERLLRADAVFATAPTYTNQFGKRYIHNADGTFQLKHCVWFRKHGWPIFQYGKDQSISFLPLDGRFAVDDWKYEQNGPDGKDFDLNNAIASESPIKLLRQVALSEIGYSTGRFVSLGKGRNLDGLLQLLNLKSSVAYANVRTQILSANSSNPKGIPWAVSYTTGPNNSLPVTVTPNRTDNRLWAKRLAPEDFAALAMCVNQLVEGKPLRYEWLRIPYGNRILDFNAPFDTVNSANSLPYPNADFHSGGLFIGMNVFAPFGTGYDAFSNPTRVGPLPANCFGCILGPGSGIISTAHYWMSWLTSKGVAIKTEADLPASWAAQKTAFNYKAGIYCDWSTRISNVVAVGSDYYGDVTITAPVRFENDIAFSQGAAYFATGSVSGHSGQFTALASYVGVKWVTISDLQTLIESIGGSFYLTEQFIPLKLERLSLNKTLADVPGIANVGTFTGRTIIQKSMPGGHEAAFEAAGQSGVRPLESDPGGHPKLVTKQISWRLADDASECEWKEPVGGTPPFLAYYKKNRSFGKFDGGNVSAFGNFDRHIYNAIGFHLGCAIQIDSGRVGYPAFAYCDDGVSSGNGGVPLFYSSTPPWFPADRIVYNASSEAPYGQRSANIRFAAGPYVWKRIADGDASQDRLCAYMNDERDWCAVSFYVSPGIAPANTIKTQGVAVIGRVLDWWAQNVDTYFTNWRGQQTGGVNSKTRAIPAAGPQDYTLTTGINVLKPLPDEARRILCDPDDVTIDLR